MRSQPHALTACITTFARARPVEWTVHRTPTGFVTFVFIGCWLACSDWDGWANVPALNLMMGAPLKVAAGTSSLILAMSSLPPGSTSTRVAMIPIIVVPSVIGMMLGAMVGAPAAGRVGGDAATLVTTCC